jgi:hypothetical protein
MEIHGRSVRMFGPGSKEPGFESQSYPITLSPHGHQCSSTGLSKAEWFVDLPAILAPKRRFCFEIIRKE